MKNLSVRGENQHTKLGTRKKVLKQAALIFSFSMWAAITVACGQYYVQTHDFRSPVIFQSPVVEKKEKLLKPISQTFPEQAQAEELPEIKIEDVNVFDQASVREYVRYRTIQYFGADQWEAMDNLLTGESNYQTYVMNHEGSGACGIFQFLPCGKLGNQGLDLENQVTKGLEYIARRYKNPTLAFQFWSSQSPHWY